jgi:hypothetical protein
MCVTFLCSVMQVIVGTGVERWLRYVMVYLSPSLLRATNTPKGIASPFIPASNRLPSGHTTMTSYWKDG